MKRVYLLLIILCLSTVAQAQYTEIINSKRPGFSESPYSIGTNVFQVESGLFYRKDNERATFTRPKSFGGNVFLRYGKFMEKLEFNLAVSYQKEEVRFTNFFTSSYNIKGVSQLTVGAKYLIFKQEYTDKSKEIRSWKRRMAFDKKRLIPSVGVYVGLNTNFLGKDFKEEGMSPKAAILLQNDFNDRLVILTNIIGDKLTTDFRTYSYIMTMTYAINQRWSYFVEHQGIFQKYTDNEFHLGTGLAYLFSNDLQIDASFRTNFLQDYTNAYAAIGFSWRMDRHQDQVIYNNPIEERIKTGKNRKRKSGFFSRIFGKKRRN